MQEAFSITIQEKFGFSDPIPSESEIRSAFQTENTAVYHIILNEHRIGGAVITINEKHNIIH